MGDRLFDEDGKLIDREGLKSVGFAMTGIREPGSPNGPLLKYKQEGQKAKPSKGYTP